jgi:hypothetical protein
MIDHDAAILFSINAAVSQLHSRLLLGGYERSELLSEEIESTRQSMKAKAAAGQDWGAYSSSEFDALSDQAQEEIDDLWQLEGLQAHIAAIERLFDQEGKPQWVAVYIVELERHLYVVTARLSSWRQPEIGVSHARLDRGDPDADEPTLLPSAVEPITQAQRETVIVKVNNALYGEIERMHARHISNGYGPQKAAYERFLASASNQGYCITGKERFAVASTDESFGDQIDPERTEAVFRDSWFIPIQGMSVLTADYFPTLDGLDRWFVAYRLEALGIGFSVFVKYYPHRRPQVEIVTDSSGL